MRRANRCGPPVKLGRLKTFRAAYSLAPGSSANAGGSVE
jgi:hypothetical protein